MSRTDKSADMSKVSPFLIKRCIDKEIGAVQEYKKLKTGALLIKCHRNQAQKLMELKQLNAQINVKCEEHQNFNMSKGKIFSRDLSFLSDEEIISELSDQKVIGIKRIKRRDLTNNKTTDEDNGIYILSFKTCTVAETIQIGYNYIAVTEFIPDPFRCYKCFRLGHSSEKCREEQKRCPNCSRETHTNKNDETGLYEKCTHPANCVNCHEDHNSLFRKCNIFKKEKEIQYIRVKNKVSYFEARRRYKIQHPLPITFSRIIQPQQPMEQHDDEPTNSAETNQPSAMDTEPSTSEQHLSLPNTKKITTKDGKEVLLIPKNTPKHKIDKMKGEQKKKEKKVKYENKLTSSENDSTDW